MTALILVEGKALEIPTVTEVKGDDGPVPVRPAANDAYKVSNGRFSPTCANIS